MSETDPLANGDSTDSEESDSDDSLTTQLRESLAEIKPLATKVGERLPDTPSTATTSNAVTTAVDTFTSALAGLAVTTAVSVSKIVPFSERFFRGMINAGYRGLYGKTDCDAIGHILVGNEVKQVPVSYNYEKGRYENRHGDYWNVASEGDYEYRMAGRVPTVWASASSNELGSHVQAEVAEVLDQGKNQPMVNADVDVVLDANQAGAGSTNGSAVADGGYALEVDNVSDWVDEIVDLRHDADARVLSLEKYFETYPSVVAPEEMKMQEERGKMSENDRDYAKMAIYLMLIAAGIIAIVELGPIIVRNLFGGSGGGGGGGGGGFLPAALALAGSVRQKWRRR